MQAPSGARLLSILGVDYALVQTQDGGDLYLTAFGAPFSEHLKPENWYEQQWFVPRRTRLEGTCAIYRVPTKPVRGLSLNLIVRFSRLGQEIPLAGAIIDAYPHAEFNDPFQEFALVMQLRNCLCAGARILTKKPLAIYVPSAVAQEWQTGRSASKMAAKQAMHPDIPLLTRRDYILLYGWIKGLNAVEVARAFNMSGPAAEEFLKLATLRTIVDLKQRGFRVLDMKPEHVVMRIFHDGSLLRLRGGKPAYALVDYELLERTPSYAEDSASAPSDLCAS